MTRITLFSRRNTDPSVRLHFLCSVRGMSSDRHVAVDYLVKIRLAWDLTIPISPDVKPYFTADIPEDLSRIIFNDWPYSGAPLGALNARLE